MSVFVMNSPKLEKLELISVRGEQHQDAPFFQFLSQSKDLKIKELSICARIANNDLIMLSESDLKLTSLTLKIHSSRQLGHLQILMPLNSLVQLLEQQSEYLERFSISGFYYIAEYVPFPFMKQLKEMYGNYPGPINYAKQTPSLEIIHKDSWWIYSNKEKVPALGVKEVCFWPAATTANEILGALQMFPNISKLEISAYAVYGPIVFNSLPNLEELTLNTISNIDVLLTGLTYRGYKDAIQTLGNWTPDFDDSGIQIGIGHSPISVLNNLKLLRLRASNCTKLLEVTAVSFCLVLMKMPSLQILDLCERSEAPDKVIPKAVLKEFRKKCLILWEPKAGIKPSPISSL